MNNIFVIFSEDEYSINKEINKIIEDTKITDITKYDLIFTKIDEVIYDCMSDSIFSDKKMAICYNSNFLTSEEKIESKILDNYIKNPNPNVCLIFVLENKKIDSRKKIVSDIKKNHKVIELKKPDVNDARVFIKEALKDFKIEETALNKLIELTDLNLSIINNELDKLKLYKNDNLITLNDVITVVPSYKEYDLFMLIDAILKNDKNDILRIYSDLIINKEEPIKIMVTLANQFRLIYQVKKLSKTIKESEIATHLNIHPYRVKLAKEKAVHFSFEKLEELLLQLAELDIKIKTSAIDKVVGLELFLLQI